ncbi:UNVERIFIED_CONTAM: hypothetical protein GTU68_045837, partial [Idotea baltica]|nr:hypothetical protein [Idotea baltica]
SKNIVIIPTYNEKDNVEQIIKAIFALEESFHVLIIDDASPDGTADIVKRMQSLHPIKLHLLERAGKLGLGTAYITGFHWSIEKKYEFIFEMDADFSHNPKDLVNLLHAFDDATVDMAVGSRYIKGGKVENWPLGRILLSYFASVYARMVTWMPIKDTTAGFVCYRRSVLEAIDLNKIQFVGYAFQIEMKFATWQLGFNIKEVPITFVDRVFGVSKMNTDIFNEAFMGVLSLKWKSFFKSYGSKKLA